ncbi:MAG TPA: hypothetical protein VEW48_07115 [Thermoanaerobaculia bacterium]|nr:hypothetical protein [Thermoanaerobaculia bacterium]
MRKIYLALPLLALPLGVLACRQDDGPPVARVDVTPRQLRLGYPELQTLQLEWNPTAELEGLSAQPMVFIHLLDSKKKLIRTFDHAFPQKWRPGAPVHDEAMLFQSQLAPALSPGTYTVTVGLYEGKRRWALEGLGERVDRAEYVAAQVEVPAESSSPKLVFSPQWLPVEPGADRQVLVRRWLNGGGAIRVEGVRAPGALWMVLRIPPINAANERLELKGTANLPGVLVRGCGGFEMSVSGPGTHEIEIPVDVTPNGACRIGLNANYTIVSTLNGQRRSVSLENAAWEPGAHKAEAPPPPAAPAPTSPTAS